MTKITKLILPLALLLVLVSATSPVLAQRANVAESNQGALDRLQELSSRIVSKLEHRLSMYQEFAAKVATKRTRLSQSGADVTQLDRLIDLNNTNLASAQTELTAFKNTLRNTSTDATMAEKVQVVRGGVTKVRTSLATLHASSRQLVNEITQLSK